MIANHIADQPARDEPSDSSNARLTVITGTTEPRVDSRLLAQAFGNKRRTVNALIDKHRDKFERFGKVLFKKAPSPGSKTGQSERYALLNEDQSYLLFSLSRNSAAVVELKTKLVKSFAEARRAADIRKTEYLPLYHEAHDQIKVLANGDPGEHFVHMNLNKLMNKVVGIEARHRASAHADKQALLAVGLMIVNDAMQGAPDCKTAYERAKEAVQPLQRLAIRRAS